jgi:hypothetical protein
VGFVVIKVTLRHVFSELLGFFLPAIIAAMFMQGSYKIPVKTTAPRDSALPNS